MNEKEKIKKLSNIVNNKLDTEWKNALIPHVDGFFQFHFLYLIFQNVPNDQTSKYGRDRLYILFTYVCLDVVYNIIRLYNHEFLKPLLIRYLKNMHFIYSNNHEENSDISLDVIRDYIHENINFYEDYIKLFRKKFKNNFNERYFDDFVETLINQLLYYIIDQVK